MTLSPEVLHRNYNLPIADMSGKKRLWGVFAFIMALLSSMKRQMKRQKSAVVCDAVTTALPSVVPRVVAAAPERFRNASLFKHFPPRRGDLNLRVSMCRAKITHLQPGRISK